MTPALRSTLFLLWLALHAAAPALAQSHVPVPPAVAARAAAGEAVDVIVGVAVPFAAEGRLTAPAAASQRAFVARAVEDLAVRAAAVGATAGEPFDGLPYFRARVSGGALAALAALPGVASVEEVVAYRPLLAESTALVHAPAAWTAGATGDGWTVAVLDTGVQVSHPFLAGRVVAQACYSSWPTGASLCPGGGASSLAVGSGEPCTGLTGCDHGTHVAGIAVGAAGPGGVNGVAPGANLIAMQVFTRANDDRVCGTGGSPCLVSSNADILSGLARVLALAGAGNGGRIAAVNISIGGAAFSSQAACDAANPSLKTAIDSLRAYGIATVIAAGNTGQSDAVTAPACISSAISVGATTDTAPVRVPGYSNDAPFLSLLAPGSDITSSVAGGGYAVKSGTSMAAPHVTGAWAVLKHALGAAPVDAVLAALSITGTPVVDPGTGRSHPLIDVEAARRTLTGAGGTSVPEPPQAFDATVNGYAVTFTWTAPVAGPAPAGYVILGRAVAGGPLTAVVPVGNVTSWSTTAAAGVYVVSVVATNADGASAESNALTVTLPGGLGRPDPPSNLQATVAGDSAAFRWTAPSAGGPVEQYVLIVGDVPGFWIPRASIVLPPAQISIVIPDVPPGIYYARVFARNRYGPSAYSTNEVTVAIAGAPPPAAPILQPPIVRGPAVTVVWSANFGPVPTSYVLAAATTPGGPALVTIPVTGFSATFPAVAPGTYFLRLYARNAAGLSPPSNEVLLVVP